MTFEEATGWCNDYNGWLPVPSSPKEIAFLNQMGPTWHGINTTMNEEEKSNMATFGDAPMPETFDVNKPWVDWSKPIEMLPATCYLVVNYDAVHGYNIHNTRHWGDSKTGKLLLINVS